MNELFSGPIKKVNRDDENIFSKRKKEAIDMHICALKIWKKIAMQACSGFQSLCTGNAHLP